MSVLVKKRNLADKDLDLEIMIVAEHLKLLVKHLLTLQIQVKPFICSINISVFVSLIGVKITNCMDLETTHDEKTIKKGEVMMVHEENEVVKVDTHEGNEVIKVEMDDDIPGTCYGADVHEHNQGRLC